MDSLDSSWSLPRSLLSPIDIARDNHFASTLIAHTIKKERESKRERKRGTTDRVKFKVIDTVGAIWPCSYMAVTVRGYVYSLSLFFFM